MRKSIRSFVTFTRTERRGIFALLAVMLVLIAVRIAIPLLVHPKTDAESEKRLTEAWETFKRSQPEHNAADDTDIHEGYVFYKGSDPMPDIVDLNTADSSLLVRLKGIGPVTAHRIIEWRSTKGPFTSTDQVQEAGVNNATFELLKTHLTVKEESIEK